MTSSARARRRHPLFVQREHAETPRYRIGEVAAITGASPKAIRLYEARRLLPPIARLGKYRVYSERDIFLVHMLKHAQSLGFRLEELRGLVAEKVRGKRFPLAVANTLFAAKRREVRAEVARLQQALRDLEAMRREMNRRFGG
jgi:MerR family transcriptional regulator, copper efflux regulator